MFVVVEAKFDIGGRVDDVLDVLNKVLWTKWDVCL